MPEGILASNIGFMLSFENNASPSLDAATYSYNAMERAMKGAMKTAAKTTRFDQGTSRVVKDLNKVTTAGTVAAGSLGLFKGATQSGLGNVNITNNTRIPKMAEGGVVTSPTLVLAGEAGPEAIIPLKDMASMQTSGMGEPSSLKSMSKMFKEFSKVKKEWGESFGKKAKSFWDSFKRDSKQVEGNTEGIADNLSDISVMTAINGLRDAFGEMRGIGDAEGSVDSFRESTQALAEVRGLSHKQVIEERNELRQAYKGLSGDINIITDSYVDLTRKGFALNKENRELGAGMGLLKEMTGVDLTESVNMLSQTYGMNSKSILDLYSSMRQVTKDDSFKTTFGGINEVLEGVLPQISVLSKNLSEVEKVNVAKSLSALVGGLQSAGVEAGTVSGLTDMIVTSLTDPEVRKGLMKLGIDPLNAIKKGKPEEIVSVIGAISENLKAGTFFSGKMAEKYSEKFGVASDVMFQLTGKTEEAVQGINKFYTASVAAGQTTAELSSELEKQRTLWSNIMIQLKNYINTSPMLGGILDTMEGMGPALQGSWAGMMILKQLGGGVKTFIGFMVNLNWVTIATSVSTKAATVSTIAYSVAQKVCAAATYIMTTAQTLLNTAFIASPIGWIVVGVGALVAGLVIAYKKSEIFRGIVQGLWEYMKFLGSSVLFVTKGIWEFTKFIGQQALSPIFTLLDGLKSVVGFLAQTPVGGFFEWVLKGIETLTKPLGWLWDRIQGLWGMMFKGNTTQVKTSTQSKSSVLAPKLVQSQKVQLRSKSGSPEREVSLDQSEVVGVLNKVVMVLTDIRDTSKKKPLPLGRSSMSPNKLAIRGEI